HYAERPFARLAAHKKFIADRLADALLLAAAGLAWHSVGSGSLSDLHAQLQQQGASPALQGSAVLLVLAVALRTALFPAHGWLIQVMEAPTPVSALLHAGVINLGGFVLIRQAPLLEAVPLARGLLLALGLITALLAGFVMLTRVSIKVRLAWSTVAQMGFMLVECALGLYTLALLHLLGHSLYKAHAFLAASERVQASRRWQLLPSERSVGTRRADLLLAPPLALLIVLGVQSLAGVAAWPLWWSGVLALAWAPLLWAPPGVGLIHACLRGVPLVLALSAGALLVHLLPAPLLGLDDAAPDGWRELFGGITLVAMTTLYAGLVALQCWPTAVAGWRRWSYAGFYVDEAYTRLALRLGGGAWAPGATRSPRASWPAIRAAR
ncbi:MAG: NADH-quinone oxidoreductase subunit L, partial [Inhella sp.]